jgi:hypothetical protein
VTSVPESSTTPDAGRSRAETGGKRASPLPLLVTCDASCPRLATQAVTLYVPAPTGVTASRSSLTEGWRRAWPSTKSVHAAAMGSTMHSLRARVGLSRGARRRRASGGRTSGCA